MAGKKIDPHSKKNFTESGLKGPFLEKFLAITRGFSPGKGAVRVFDLIRDIPYYIDTEHFDIDTCAEAMLISGRASCFPKHRVLGDMLFALGYRVMYYVYPFYWKDQIQIVKGEAGSRAEGLPVTYHMACKIFSGEKWVTVDATWPMKLSSHGFPVNSDWSPEKNAKTAVTAIGEIGFGSSMEAFLFAKQKFGDYTLTERLELSRFTIDLNRWMAKVFSL